MKNNVNKQSSFIGNTNITMRENSIQIIQYPLLVKNLFLAFIFCNMIWGRLLVKLVISEYQYTYEATGIQSLVPILDLNHRF